MFSEADLQELLNYKGTGQVLSVFLNTDPQRGSSDFHKRNLRSMLKDVEAPRDVEAVMSYINHQHNWSGRSVAMYSSASAGFFKAYTFPVPMRSRVHLSDRPYVKPLADLLDLYGGFGVVLVDKQGARLFYFHLGELREEEGVLGESVRRTKRGGGSQYVGRRGGIAGSTDYVDEVTERNLREAAEVAARFFADNQVRRILIGGTDENVSLFRNLLPKAWQSLVVGTFSMGMNASENEILDKAIQIGEKAEERREAMLAQSVVTSAAKGKGGVIGLDDVLHAIHEGRVQTLLLREGYRASGFRCKGCDLITSVEFDVCPYCGDAFEKIVDVVELAVRKVLSSGGEVEVLHSDVPGFKQIGAVLRF